MTKKNKSSKAKENLEAVESTLSRSEQFIETNQKMITIVVLSVVGVIALYLAYQKFYRAPLEEDARSQMFVAEQYFERDSFNLALNGDITYPGFLKIVDDYSSTKSANLAHYYIGISYYNLEKYDEAIKYLKDFSTKDDMLSPISKGVIGDAYIEKGDIDEAIKYYVKAANEKENNFTSPYFLMKAGQAYETNKEFQKALELFEKIKEKYSNSNEGRTVEKYISRTKLKL